MKTKAYTQERSHEVENYIDTLINLYADDFEVYDLAQLDEIIHCKRHLIWTNDPIEIKHYKTKIKRIIFETVLDCTIKATIETNNIYTIETTIDYEHYRKNYCTENINDAYELFMKYLEEVTN